MANIEKRGDTYRITVSNGYDITGKQIRVKTTFTPDTTLTPNQQRKAFDKFVFEFEERVKNGKYMKGEKVTLKEFTELWLKDYANEQLAKTTLAFYKSTLKQKILPALGHLKISKIQPLHLQSFYSNLLEEGIRKDGKKGGYSPSTIKKCHAIISSILSTAVQWQILESNPCERVSPPKDKNIVKDIKHFTLEQTEIFLKALEMDYTTNYKAHDRIDDTGKKYHVNAFTETRDIPTQFKIFFNLALFSGLRRGELVALTWDDIDTDNNILHVTKSTGYADREMHLSTPYHTFKDIINKYNSTIKDESQKLPDIPLHGLRHTSATLLISKNTDIRTVSARLGHSQTSTTMNIYAHSLKKLDETASNTLTELLIKKA